MKITELQLQRAKHWYKDFSCVNDAYNLEKYKMTQATMEKILKACKAAQGFSSFLTATLKEVNRELKEL